jgi:hypothetical protein
VPGVDISITPAPAASGSPVKSNSAGYFTISNVPDGSYILTPGLTGASFIPATRTVTIAGANVSGQNFVARTGVTVIGRVQTFSGVAIAGVTVQLDAGPTVTTNSSGYFTHYDVANGGHTLTPAKAGYHFTPLNKPIVVSGANLAGQNFIGATGYNISGRLARSDSSGIAGATVTADTGETATSNSAGYYTLHEVPAGARTVTPNLGGTTFSPPNKPVNVVSSDVSGVNFLGS